MARSASTRYPSHLDEWFGTPGPRRCGRRASGHSAPERAFRQQVRATAIANPSTIRTATSGGLLRGNRLHEVDAALWTLDDRPVEVYARASEVDPDDPRGPIELSLVANLRGWVVGYVERVDGTGATLYSAQVRDGPLPAARL